MRRATAISVGAHAVAGAVLLWGTLAQPMPAPVPAPTLTVSLARLPPAPKPASAPAPQAEARPQSPVPPKPVASRRPPRPVATVPLTAPSTMPEPLAASAPPQPSSAPETAQRGSDGPDRSWLARVHARLAAAKRYPAAALRRRDEGVVLIEIAIDRDGNVLSRRLVQGSGSTLLDREALDLAERASPLPSMPAVMPQPGMTIMVPVSFAVRR